MKKTILLIFVLSFATGFTCSKNAPEQSPQKEEVSKEDSPDQSQMAVEAKSEDLTQSTATEPAPETK